MSEYKKVRTYNTSRAMKNLYLLCLTFFFAASCITGCSSPSVEHRIADLFSNPALSKANAQVSKTGRRHNVRVTGEFESESAYKNALEAIKQSPVSYSKEIKIVNELVLKPLSVEVISEALSQSGWKDVSLEHRSSLLMITARLPDKKLRRRFKTKLNHYASIESAILCFGC